MGGRAILADEVGLGKTIEASIIYRELAIRGLARRALILAPASLVGQWQGELEEKFFERFDTDVRQHRFHPFVPADYDAVLQELISLRAPELRFLEWGSATGVITIMADLLGFEAYGIELDPAETIGRQRQHAAWRGGGARARPRCACRPYTSSPTRPTGAGPVRGRGPDAASGTAAAGTLSP